MAEDTVNNAAAKRALTSIDRVDVFVVGHTAPEQTSKEMVDWLRANFPKVKIFALIPFANRQLPRADCNVVLGPAVIVGFLLVSKSG